MSFFSASPSAPSPPGGGTFASRLSAAGRTLVLKTTGNSPAPAPDLAGARAVGGASRPPTATDGLLDTARDLQSSLFAGSEGGESSLYAGGLSSGSFIRGGLGDAAAIAPPSVLDLRMGRDRMGLSYGPASYFPRGRSEEEDSLTSTTSEESGESVRSTPSLPELLGPQRHEERPHLFPCSPAAPDSDGLIPEEWRRKKREEASERATRSRAAGRNETEGTRPQRSPALVEPLLRVESSSTAVLWSAEHATLYPVTIKAYRLRGEYDSSLLGSDDAPQPAGTEESSLLGSNDAPQAAGTEDSSLLRSDDAPQAAGTEDSSVLGSDDAPHAASQVTREEVASELESHSGAVSSVGLTGRLNV